MSIYHLHASTGSRSTGQSAAAKAAYLARIDTYGRGRKEVTYLESNHMPDWAMHPRSDRRSAIAFAYWQATDFHERVNGRLFKELEFALPIELSDDQRIALAREFAQSVTSGVDGGNLPYALAIHRGRGRNPHCHLLISERVNDGNSRSADTWFKRAGSALGGARKTDKLKPEQWLLTTREKWAQLCNLHMARAGHGARIDHRSLSAQGKVEIPGVHVGVAGTAMQRKGQRSDRQAMQKGVELARNKQRSLNRQKRVLDLGLQCVAISRFAELLDDADVQKTKQLRIEPSIGAGSSPVSPPPVTIAHTTPTASHSDETGPGGFQP